jgi:hypothetical protein
VVVLVGDLAAEGDAVRIIVIFTDEPGDRRLGLIQILSIQPAAKSSPGSKIGSLKKDRAHYSLKKWQWKQKVRSSLEQGTISKTRSR